MQMAGDAIGTGLQRDFHSRRYSWKHEGSSAIKRYYLRLKHETFKREQKCMAPFLMSFALIWETFCILFINSKKVVYGKRSRMS